MTQIKFAFICLFLASSSLSAAGATLTEIQLKTEPSAVRVRPYESLNVQVLAFGEVEEDGEKKKVRIGGGGVQFTLSGNNAGWLSKPFRFRGRKADSLVASGLQSLFGGRPDDDFGVDAVLYTAPQRAGSYEIEAQLKDKKAKIKIEVHSGARSFRKAERTSFPAEPHAPDPYRKLAEHHSPFLAQETWFQPKSDYVARFDFDGDFQGDNNWDSAFTGSSQAYVYYAVMETRTHWFLVYDILHPRDYSDNCIAGTCHENDSEGLILTVLKDGSQFGRLQTMETLAHNNIYSYRADRQVRNSVHGIDGDVEFYQSHPVVFIESGGHGVYGSSDKHSRYKVKHRRFTGGTGVTYVYRGQAQRPQHANHQLVGYDLLSAWEHLWVPGHTSHHSQNKMYDDYFAYQPYGNRPEPPYPEIAGAFLGRKRGSNKAKPFWGWKDRRTDKKKILATGQWGLDPAYATSQNLKFPGSFSLDYVFNPFLGIDASRAPEVRSVQTLAQPSAAAPEDFVQQETFQKTLQARTKDYDSQSRKGQFDLKLRIDEEVEVQVKGASIRYEVIRGREPSDDGSEYSQEIPRAIFKKFEVEKKDGRGNILVMEKPSAQNEFNLKLRIIDRKGGDDRYHARIKWERERLQPPAPPKGQPILTVAPPAPDRVVLSEAPVPTPQDPAGTQVFSKDNDPGDYDRDRDGEFEFRGRIDGSVVISLRRDEVFIRVLNGHPVEVDRFSFSQPLPPGLYKSLELEKKDGRGEVLLQERPWEGNDHAAVIQISDPKGGDDRYHFKFKWKR